MRNAEQSENITRNRRGNGKWWILTLLFTIHYSLFTAFTGCAKKKIVRPSEQVPTMEKQAEEPSLRGKNYKKTSQLETVYFDYDDATLRSNARDMLAKNASWLKGNPDVEIIVGGHCDERGTTDYNIALGDRRAKSVRSYLTKLGIKGNRIATISYGEEKPADFGHDESSWSKNRRAELLGRIPEK